MKPILRACAAIERLLLASGYAGEFDPEWVNIRACLPTQVVDKGGNTVDVVAADAAIEVCENASPPRGLSGSARYLDISIGTAWPGTRLVFCPHVWEVFDLCSVETGGLGAMPDTWKALAWFFVRSVRHWIGGREDEEFGWGDTTWTVVWDAFSRKDPVAATINRDRQVVGKTWKPGWAFSRPSYAKDPVLYLLRNW